MLRSNVRIEVSFENPVVFAGEQLSAIVTFHNTSSAATVTRDRQGSLSTQEPSSPVVGSAGAGASLGRSASFRHAPAKSVSIPSHDESRSFFGSRRTSLSIPMANRTENLLMGFAQLQGFFQLDDSIVDSSAFEHIRTQGIIVGQKGLGYGGSGSGGFLRGLTHGLGSLLTKVDEEGPGSGRSTSAEDSFPIFSTPQSLLFVDLKLAPGESKSYGYHIQIPKTLPPSSRGKAIRISYNLAIGTQRLDARGRPVPRIILVPFRVFPFVDPFGDMPVHSLSEPFVEKEDKALVSHLSDRKPSMKSLFAIVKTRKLAQPQQDILQNKSKQDQLLGYISELISTAEQEASNDKGGSRLGSELFKGTLGTGSGAPASRHPSTLAPESQDVRENIEYFIRYQYLEAEKPFKSTFEIGRSGMRIAMVCLSKPIYRVGEDIVILLDFANAALKCRHVTASLEASESISEEYARRPPQDIRNMTRRVFVQLSSSSFSTSKTHFDLTIPSSATPQFSTSAISLSWYIQLTFVTSTTSSRSDIIEALTTDTHGMMVRAKSELDCVSVTCHIPITVFPTNQDIGTLLDYSSIVRKWTI